MSNFDLGKRAVACRHFRWASGMYLWRANVRLSCKPGWESSSAFRAMYGDDIPALSDIGTRAMLLDIVRGAFERPLSAIYLNGEWVVATLGIEGLDVVATGKTEAEAVVAALEATS